MFDIPHYKHPRYRAWIKPLSMMVEVLTISYQSKGWIYFIDKDGINQTTTFDNCVLMKMTDYFDVNGKTIYIGDVVKGHKYQNTRAIRHIGFVNMKMKVMGLKQYTWYQDDLCSNYEIIGNVYENPELVSDDKFPNKYSEQN